MKHKVILVLLTIAFNAVAKFDDSSLEEITLLSNQDAISYEEGIEALLALTDVFFAQKSDDVEDGEPGTRKTFYKIHNRLFVLTHMARIRHQMSQMSVNGRFMFTAHEWQTQALMERLTIKRNQLEALKQALEIVSSEDFNHKDRFESLSDLVNMGVFTNTNGYTANTFSKSFSKAGYGRGRDLWAVMTSSFEESLRHSFIATVPTDVLNFQRGAGFLHSQTVDLGEGEDPLSEKAFDFLNRLGISGPTPYFAQKDLSNFYRTASSSQGQSKACVGFALAADMEVELQQKRQLRQNEILSPFLVYASLLYQESGMQSSKCLELYVSSEIMARGGWEGDLGIESESFYDLVTKTDFCLASVWKDKLKHTGYVSIKNIEKYEGEITFSLLKTMIDYKKPPILHIDSDAREEVEDWIRITGNGRFEHIFVVVGYGTEDIDPFTLRKGPYFLIRDSLGSRPIHYKVSAENLLKSSFGVFKISQLERH